MKKYLLLLLTVFALNSCEQDPEIIGIDAEKKQLKVDVCHYDADTDTWKTLSISENALKAHLKHGDYEGECCEGKTYVPDDSFERWLIIKGYDDVPDNYVLNCNIHTVTSLRISERDGDDLFFQNLIGIEGFKNLESLVLNDMGFIQPLDLSKNLKLQRLSLTKAPMGEINLGVNDNFTSVFMVRSNVRSIDLTGCINLKSVSILESEVRTTATAPLDLSKNINLESFKAFAGGAEYVNLQNGNNINLNFEEDEFDWLPPIYVCVQVDSEQYSRGNWVVPDPNVFSEDCGF